MGPQRDVFDDLVLEGAWVDGLVDGLDDSEWEAGTPAPGWTVAHQIAHLTMVFSLAEKAAAAPRAFGAVIGGLKGSFDEAVQAGLLPYLGNGNAKLLDQWRAQRAATERALSALPPEQIVPWLVRPIPAGVLAAAGMMELFAHGQDIADARGTAPERTDRIRHVAGFVALTWDFGYRSRELPVPGRGLRFEVTGPSGAEWVFGDLEADECVSGPAVDLCLLATRRRHRDDLALSASGPVADQWLDIAQAYRGSAGPGRKPGQFARRARG
ncbi:TIGR03084 family metal-binding protein [Streptomyces sp. NPDC017529]|uniref:TIGR03084 family metal-binding protein n=1 Tax=Streptomyces sp. NPDC017529 TaxID=3365000 RepID=UPI0037886AF8